MNTNNDISNLETKCHLTFHGSAANSCPHSLLWVRAPSSSTSLSSTTKCNDGDNCNNNAASSISGNDNLVDTIIYASSGIINIATSYPPPSSPSNNNKSITNYNNVTSVNETLVTRTLDYSLVEVAETKGEGEGKKKLLARGEAVEDAAANRSITALSWVSSNSNYANNNDNYSGVKKVENEVYGIIAAYSDGTVTSHRYHNSMWSEHVIVGNDPCNPLSSSNTSTNSTTANTTDNNANNRIYIHNYQESLNQSKLHESISDISCIQLDYNTWLIVTTSCVGIYLHISYVTNDEESTSGNDSRKGGGIDMVYTHEINGNGFASVELLSSTLPSGGNNENKTCYLFAGSANPKNNKIYVYTIPYCTTSTTSGASEGSSSKGGASVKKEAWVNLPSLEISEPIYHGNLLGHQDWITCFSWLTDFNTTSSSSGSGVGNDCSLLASSGHDAKIRLWKFSTYTSTSKDSENVSMLENKEEEMAVVVSDSDDDEANIDDLEEEEGEARLVITHSSETSSSTTTTAVSLEALLLGHEEAVTSLTWRPNQTTTTNKKEKPCLLSSSMDRTILLWMEEKDEEDEGGNGGGGVWVPISRVGSAGGILGGSIGASLMGFVDATFSPTDATRIVGHGYGGSIHFWTQVLPEKKNESAVNAIEAEKIEEVETEEKIEDETLEEEEDINPPQAFEWAPPGDETTADIPQEVEDEEEDILATARWVADPCITGHFRSVEDMAWEPNGEYLLTTSSDQTTRLWTEVPVAASDNQYRWVEVGRPQVHGYDMTSIVCIGGEDDSGMGDGEPCHRFVSGADEKVLRVFDAPSSTLRVLQSIKQARGDNTRNEEGSEVEKKSSLWRVERAFMPSLGLTNKATADPEDQEVSKFGPVDDDNDDVAQPLESATTTKSTTLQYPNVERDLAVTTLWPESRKLFGHESELVCLASYRAPSGSDMSSLVASSCKARNDVESAAIRLWDAKKGKCVGILKGGHRSTVSTMSFSQDGKYLASSGKDRRICIWKRVNDSQDDGPGYELSAAADSAHKRIVWSVHFCPKRPDILASGSRDGFVKIWRVIEGDDGSLEMMEMELCRFEPLSKAGSKNPVTAVAFADDIIEGTTDYGILSIGTESGRIEVWAVPISSSEESTAAPTLLYVLPPNESHFDTVKKVAWRPSTTSTEGDEEDIVNLTLASCGQDNGVRIFKLAIKKSEAPPPDEDVVEEIREAPANVNAVESGPKKKLICLVSNGCHDRIQSANQSKALDWFIARKVPHTVVDGMDPEQRGVRNKLFGISGIRGNYPQFFFELEDGTLNFFGNFQKIEELNETNDIPKELLEQHPEIETWDKVFRDCS